jgi:hypothetical protein
MDEKISAERSWMARLECTVAHMDFPAATLNKRIKKKLPFSYHINIQEPDEPLMLPK